jgi:hypothetical protein
MTTSLDWKRDAQGLHADSTDGTLRFYVRRDGRFWRAGYSDIVEVAGTRVADVSKPIERIDTTDTQRLAKGICEAFDVEPWSDGGPQRRSTRAISRAYAADQARILAKVGA